jgi:hypothetical protein
MRHARVPSVAPGRSDGLCLTRMEPSIWTAPWPDLTPNDPIAGVIQRRYEINGANIAIIIVADLGGHLVRSS